MPIRIFTKESGSTEEWLQNDDYTVTHHIENSGWAMRDGIDARERTMSAEEAKAEWDFYKAHIDVALVKVAANNRS